MDAAYNYEYVSRVRDQVARSAGKPAKELPRIAARAAPAGRSAGRPHRARRVPAGRRPR